MKIHPIFISLYLFWSLGYRLGSEPQVHHRSRVTCHVSVCNKGGPHQCLGSVCKYVHILFLGNIQVKLQANFEISGLHVSNFQIKMFYISLILLSARDFKIFLLSTIHTYIQQYTPYKNNNSIVRKLHRHNMIFS